MIGKWVRDVGEEEFESSHRLLFNETKKNKKEVGEAPEVK
jgi:hypothetical protein